MLLSRKIPIEAQEACVLTIGNFDGVHRGHHALLTRLKAKARELGLPATVLCFEPHPREFFAPASAPPRLCSLRRKLQLMAEVGVDRVIVQRFDRRFAGLDATRFIEEGLVKGLGVRHLMIGDDFRFGRGRDGDLAALEKAGQRFGFGVEAMHTLVFEGERVSSSAVREALLAGEIEHATRLLGEPFVLEGRVQHGDRIGRTMGFPTANLCLRQASLPLSGVFAVRVDGGPLQGAMGAASIGFRPTVGEKLALRLEVFVLDFSGSLYGERLRLSFRHKVAEQRKFDSLAALQTAINGYCDEVRAYFAARPEL